MLIHFFLNKNWRQQRRRKFQQRRRRQSSRFFDLRIFLLRFHFRAMFLFSFFRIMATKVICKAATDLRKFQRRLMLQAIIMLNMRQTRSWTENCIFLEDDMMAQRYFSICLRFRKTAKLLLEIINQKRLKIKLLI